MQRLIPGDSVLKQYIDYYWIIESFSGMLHSDQPIYEFPSLSPELVINLNGYFNYSYKGKKFNVKESILFSFIDKSLELHPTPLSNVIIIKFKNTALSSLLPFISVKPKDLIKKPIISPHFVFGPSFNHLEKELKKSNECNFQEMLDSYFLKLMNEENKGFINEIVRNLDTDLSVKNISELTNSSYSTIERYFKKDAGLTPKQFLMIHRFKSVMEELYLTGNTDWMEYVVKYNYHDQNHFIKEIKRFSGFTPKQLINIPGLFPHRPI